MNGNEQAHGSAVEQDPEAVFRGVRKIILDERERELEQLRADAEAARAVGARVEEASRRIWERSGLDLAAVDELRAAETRHMHAFLEQTWREAVGQDPMRGPHLRDEIEQALDRIQAGDCQPYLIGADVVTATPERLDRYEGERGNPATWLYDASAARYITSSTTGGPGCTGGWTYCPDSSTWYFAWPASAVGEHSVQAWFGYYGYYQLYAVPLPPDYCTFAGVQGRAKLDIYQQVGYPPKYSKPLGKDAKTFFDKATRSIVSAGPVEGSDVLTADVVITTVSQVYIAVTITADSGASGQPAFAKLDFAEAGHHLAAPFVIVSA